MDVRILGPSGLRVSQLCLGTATFGNRDWGSDAAGSARVLGHFLDLGGNFVDTANKYADGASEQILGTLLRGRRDRVVLASKYTATMDDTDVNGAGNHRKNLARSLRDSLRRLQTDYLDLLWVHAWDGVTGIEELMRALDDQIRAGTVLSVGISNAPSWMTAWGNAVAVVRGWSPFVAVQNEYSLLQRGAERELLPMTRYFGLAYLAWAPIAQGRLTGKYTAAATSRRLSAQEARMSAEQQRIIAETLAVANEVGCAPAAVALRWIMQHRPEVIPVVGARSYEQLVENLSCLKLHLTTGQMNRLTAVSAIDLGSPVGFLRSPAGRDFMWGSAATVPPRTALATRPWWEAE